MTSSLEVELSESLRRLRDVTLSSESDSDSDSSPEPGWLKVACSGSLSGSDVEDMIRILIRVSNQLTGTVYVLTGIRDRLQAVDVDLNKLVVMRQQTLVVQVKFDNDDNDAVTLKVHACSPRSARATAATQCGVGK